MKKFPLFLLLVCGSVVFTACSDDDDEEMSKADILKGKKWQITALTGTNPFAPGAPTDFYAGLEDCQKDNYLEYQDGNVLLLNEGASKCDPADEQQMQGTWRLDGDTLRLNGVGQTLDLPFNDLKFVVKELSSTSLSADYSQTLPGFPITITGSVTMKVMP